MCPCCWHDCSVKAKFREWDFDLATALHIHSGVGRELRLQIENRWISPLNVYVMQGIANRDLKLENLLLDRDGHDGTRPLLKICDFGYSKVPMLNPSMAAFTKF